MSSSIMHKPLAISMQEVSKIYKLHGSQGDQLIDVLGLQRLGFKTKTVVKEFVALSNISLEVPRGHRIGIIGRNGAGKTTLLKLICGNFSPTQGVVEVNGTVQALMNIGLGFHPEYTGRENVEASLQYNGLGREEYRGAMEDIIKFCELGDFFDQPFKTYSLGMQARLMFATATAIHPDILIVDEVLAAGDACFIAKSKARVENLVNSGCTMLLVSHSMQQVLELCDEAIWLDEGRIRMQGESFLVVKKYEEYLHGTISQISLPVSMDIPNEHTDAEVVTDFYLETRCLQRGSSGDTTGLAKNSLLQEPYFLPHEDRPILSNDIPPGFHFLASGGLSRWDSEQGLKVVGFAVITEQGLKDTLVAMKPAKFVITLVAELDGIFHCRYGIALHDLLGACITRIFSQKDYFEIQKGERRQVEILLNPCQIGPGQYTIGISVLDYASIEKLNNIRRYDLLSRSFAVQVVLPESMGALECKFFQTAEWKFNN